VLAFAMSFLTRNPLHAKEIVGLHFWCRQDLDGVWRVEFLGEFVGLAKTREEALCLALGAYEERVESVLDVYPHLGEDGAPLGAPRSNLRVLRRDR
jgi:hypothetical protein